MKEARGMNIRYNILKAYSRAAMYTNERVGEEEGERENITVFSYTHNMYNIAYW